MYIENIFKNRQCFNFHSLCTFLIFKIIQRNINLISINIWEIIKYLHFPFLIFIFIFLLLDIITENLHKKKKKNIYTYTSRFYIFIYRSTVKIDSIIRKKILLIKLWFLICIYVYTLFFVIDYRFHYSLNKLKIIN